MADFLNSYLRSHVVSLWGEQNYLVKHGDYADIKVSEIIGMHNIYHLAAAAVYLVIGYDRSEFRGYWEAAKYCGL